MIKFAFHVREIKVQIIGFQLINFVYANQAILKKDLMNVEVINLILKLNYLKK
jgi:hypothetical protein